MQAFGLGPIPNNPFYKAYQALRQQLRPHRARQAQAQQDQTRQMVEAKGLTGLVELADFHVFGLSTDSDFPLLLFHGEQVGRENGWGGPSNKLIFSTFLKLGQQTVSLLFVAHGLSATGLPLSEVISRSG